MLNNLNNLKFTIITSSGVAGVFLTQIFGEWNDSLFALVIMMAIDFITGLIVAGLFQKSTKTFSGGLSSRVCAKGIAKKVAMIFLVAVAYQGDKILGVDYFRTAVIWALCASEILSIIENAGAMEMLPESVQKIFRKIIDALNADTKKHMKDELDKQNKDEDDDD